MSLFKAHYFLWYGSLSCFMPFVPIFASAHSLANAEDVGILFFVLPFIVALLKPLFCSIADRNNSHRKVLIISILMSLFGYALLLTNLFINFGSFSWYWFCILILLANTGQGIAISLTDYLVMKEVTELKKTFGSYRLFGPIGWGGFGLIAGAINEYITQLPYLLPGLILYIVIETIDLICIYFKLKAYETNSNSMNVETVVHKKKSLKGLLKKPLVSTSKSLKQIYRIFRNNPSLLKYIIIVIIFGSLTSFQWTYYFWFIQEIRGKDPLLMGLTLFFQSFLGEIPIFYISNRILRCFGPSMSLNIGLSTYALKFFIYGFVFKRGTTYWDVLIIELTQGLTFSLFYTVMTDLAQSYAKKDNKREINNKTEEMIENENNVNKSKVQNNFATMQAIMSSAFEGLGRGVGALIGGYIINRIDIFYIWKFGGVLAVLTILFNISIDLINYFVKK